MKKTMRKLPILAGAALVLALGGVAQAKIQGQCSDCHTMHNSEEGNPVAFQYNNPAGATDASFTPNPVLLKYDCMACHAMDQGNAIVQLSGGSDVPQVYGNYGTDLDQDLAGGNFAYIDGHKGGAADDRKGHNVIDILNADLTLTGPPGYTRGPQTATKRSNDDHKFEMASQFTCAGKAGCHGVRNQLVAEATHDANGVELTPAVERVGLAALTGAHHYDEGGQLTTADDVYNSYRFLLGTQGFEADDWKNTDGSNHNEYFGIDNNNFAGAGGCARCHIVSHGPETVGYVTNVSGTMTNLCETCHSNFHSTGVQGTTAFLRHPSDYVIQSKTEYAKITTWDKTAPVARAAVPAAPSAAAGPGDLVQCLSCHVAHASPYAHMLRFNYTTMTAGGTDRNTGCFVCHTTKDTGDGLDWANPMLQ
jgi:hypothetical protein